MGFMLWTWIVIPRYVLCLLFLSIAKKIMRWYVFFFFKKTQYYDNCFEMKNIKK
jgi:hypothetical protein